MTVSLLQFRNILDNFNLRRLEYRHQCCSLKIDDAERGTEMRTFLRYIKIGILIFGFFGMAESNAIGIRDYDYCHNLLRKCFTEPAPCQDSNNYRVLHYSPVCGLEEMLDCLDSGDTIIIPLTSGLTRLLNQSK